MNPSDVTDEIAVALAILRTFTGPGGGQMLPGQIVQAINVLDNAGVFAEIDEATHYASAEDILRAAAEKTYPNTLDPAEWGDTTSADVARRQGYVPALDRLGSLEYPRATGELDASDRAAEGRLARKALGLD